MSYWKQEKKPRRAIRTRREFGKAVARSIIIRTKGHAVFGKIVKTGEGGREGLGGDKRGDFPRQTSPSASSS